MKAQLYKMTLYICDLEDSLSLDEIKTLIRQDALDGVAVNCVCHFADEQIGKQVEWDDDIDLNECGCPTFVWDKYFTPPTEPKTNADRIRAMSDEELVLFVRAFINSSRCPYDWKGCENCWLKELCNANAYNGELEWLHAPAEGE